MIYLAHRRKTPVQGGQLVHISDPGDSTEIEYMGALMGRVI
jgi:hypothetical protein